jgi:hypothetical protein
MPKHTQSNVLALVAMVGILVGWYGLDLVLVTVGPLRYDFHFPDAWNLIARPMQTLAATTSRAQPKAGFFAVVCVAALLLPIAPHVLRKRIAWLAYAAPLVLMCVCAIYAYTKFSGQTFANSYHPHTLGARVTDFANRVVGRAGSVSARRVKVGLGVYVSAVASLALAVVGCIRITASRKSINDWQR